MNSEAPLLTYVIDTREKLNQLLVNPAIKHRYSNVKVDATFIPVRETVSNTFNKYFYSCGCGTGAKFLFISLLIGIVGMGVANSYTIKHIALVIIACFLSGLLGKAVGLSYANYKWKQMVRKFIQLSSLKNGM